MFKDDVSELVEDDFRNQMYLKLMAHKYLESDWLWIPDADFLITSPLYKKDFFCDEKPYWYFCDWYEVAEKTWRHGSEKLLGCNIPHQFMDQPQYILNKKLSNKLTPNWNFGPNSSSYARVIDIVNRTIVKWGNYSKKIIINKKNTFHESEKLFLNINKDKKELKWKPTLSLNETIDLTVDWYKSYFLNKKMTNITMNQIEIFLDKNKY